MELKNKIKNLNKKKYFSNKLPELELNQQSFG